MSSSLTHEGAIRTHQEKALHQRVRRTLQREIAEARSGLLRRLLTNEAVHNARKRLKAARAALRLLRPALDEEAYGRENLALRDAAKPLGISRDATILAETARSLVAKCASAEIRAEAKRFVKDLERRADSELERICRTAGRRSAALLRRVRSRLAGITMSQEAGQGIGAGLRATYRKGRQQLKQARRDPSTERLHELRKQSNYLHHQLQVIAPRRRSLRGEERGLRKLSSGLGKDHDLAVLAKLMQREKAQALPARAHHALTALITGRREKRQKKALQRASELYAARPKHYEKRLMRQTRKPRAHLER
jgi:CHAD domain